MEPYAFSGGTTTTAGTVLAIDFYPDFPDDVEFIDMQGVAGEYVSPRSWYDFPIVLPTTTDYVWLRVRFFVRRSFVRPTLQRGKE
jgi:hypothetical protein